MRYKKYVKKDKIIRMIVQKIKNFKILGEKTKMRYYFTSDTHFDHNNIIKYCDRPFKDVKHMNEVLIKNWNDRVTQDDSVFIIGDFCLGKPKPFARRLNGNKIFIRGNHDHKNGVRSIIENCVINYGGKEIYLTHSPEDALGFVDLNLTGHVHKSWKIKKKEKSLMYNVGVDVNNFKPISIQEILSGVAKWKREN